MNLGRADEASSWNKSEQTESIEESDWIEAYIRRRKKKFDWRSTEA